jgi:hypothetical protein
MEKVIFKESSHRWHIWDIVDYAEKNSRPEIVELLLKHGAKE